MNKDKQIPVIVVVGPTASGKTKIGVEIAKAINGEVISCDSMQIYKELNIATAKPTKAQMQGIKHHLLSIKSVTEDYSVADYVNDAKGAVNDVLSSNKVPVFVGGTGLYIDSFINNINFQDQIQDSSVRQMLNEKLIKHGNEYLLNMLFEIDEQAAKKIHPNNTKRTIRALEVYYLTGKTITEQQALSKRKSPYSPFYIGLNFSDRQKLYDRINLRVELMVKQGLLEEVKKFYSSNPSLTSQQAIGCKELKPYIDNNATLDECIDNLKRETRRYAKRQITWFNRNNDTKWLHHDLTEFALIYDNAIKSIKDFLKNQN